MINPKEDKNLQHIERNGFIIVESQGELPYGVYHPIYDGTFLEDFKTIDGACYYCDTEDVTKWFEILL